MGGKKMNNKIINKSIICGIILLFVGTGVVPSINGIVDTTNETLNEKTIGTTYITGPGIDNWFIVDTVGWWHFDEGSGNSAYDSSSYGNNGICYGTQWTTGHDGAALSFSPLYNSVVTVDNHPSLDFNDLGEDEGFMIDFWMAIDGTPSIYHAGLVCKQYNNGYYVIQGTDSSISFMIQNGGTAHYVTSNTLIDDNDWHHIVAVWDGTTEYLYIDDMMQPDNSEYIGSFTLGAADNWLDIGNHWPTDDRNPFDGKIDEVRISIIKPIELLKTTFIFGKLTNLNTEGDFFTFEAEKIRCIQFLPFQFIQYSSGEKIQVLEEYLGILNTKFAFGIFKSVL